MSQYKPSARLDRPVIADLRSDTVTQPCDAMRAAMAAADVGDDVYGDDPTVNRLEGTLAERLGKEAGLFLPSGTQSNLVAMLAHCGRGEEVIAGERYHVIRYEAAGASVLGGIALQPLAMADDGALEASAILGAVKDDDSHHPISRLLSLENTHYGRAIPLHRISQSVEAGRAAGLNLHLDGARFFNAVTGLGCAEADLARPFDTISVCLSKGLGAPVGSVLVGHRDLVERARRWRKMLGGGLRQAGILAAAGLYALDHNVTRLTQDHDRAEALAAHMRALDLGAVTQATNMVFLTPRAGVNLGATAARHGIRLSGAAPQAPTGADQGNRLPLAPQAPIRMVLHRDIDDAAFAIILTAMSEVAEASDAA